MKFVYFANTGLFDEWAHTVQILKMCEAFALNGAEVTLIVPKRKGPKKEEVFAKYNIKPVFRIVQPFCIDFFHGSTSKIWYWLRIFSFLVSSRLYLLFKKYDVFYTREFYPSIFFKRVFVERHSMSETQSKLYKFFLKKTDGFIVLTSFIKSKLVESGVSVDKILVAPDAVRLEDFENNFSKEEAREKTNLPNDKFIFGYVGTLKTMDMEKGVKTAIDSLPFLPNNFLFVVVGGEDSDIEYYKNYAKNKNLLERIVFCGKVPHAKIPTYLAACDSLVAPFPNIEHYAYFMSPLKIFEYMAAKRPMIVTNLPSLREVLVPNETALFIEPEDFESLAIALKNLQTNKQVGEDLAEKAYNEVSENFTWQKRAKGILEFFKK